MAQAQCSTTAAGDGALHREGLAIRPAALLGTNSPSRVAPSPNAQAWVFDAREPARLARSRDAANSAGVVAERSP
jgi:hypothetical protein